MKTVFTWLTLLLLGSVVGLLAVHLILIAASLWRANRNLALAAERLEAVRSHTAALGDDLTSINAAAASLQAPLHAVNESLRQIGRLVQA